MALPAAVQRELEAAEKIEAEMAAAQNPQPAAETPPPEPQPATGEAKPAEPAAAVQPDSNWEHKYSTLQTKYNAEVPRLHGQVRDMQDQLNRALGEIEQLKTKPVEPVQPAVQEPLVTEKDVESYGADLIDVATRIARQEIGKQQGQWNAEIAKRDAYINRLEKQVGNVEQRQGARDQVDFFRELNSVAPDWETLQNSDVGQTFLVTKIPGTMYTWDAALKTAAAELDVGRAAEVFGQMVAQHPELRPQAQPSGKVVSELERQVAPTRSRAAPIASTTGNDGKPRYTWNTWSQQYDLINKRQVLGDEAVKLQAELDAAYVEGRIT